MTLDELKAAKDASVNVVYNEDFIKEAKKHQHQKKETADPHRREKNFWLFSLAAFTENFLSLWAKASGSEVIVRTITELQEFHGKLLGNALLYFNLTKNIAKHMKQVKLFDAPKEPEMSPTAKRAKAAAALAQPVGHSLPVQLAEQRPVLTLGGAHDHEHAAHMCLSAIGTQFIASSNEETVS